MDKSIITVKGVTKEFGELVAVNKVDYTIGENETIGIIGPNGAGKTTLLNLITGYYIPDDGIVLYRDQDITGLSPEKRVSLGIVRTFQLAHVFDNLRVLDHLALSYFRKTRRHALLWKMLFSTLNQKETHEKVAENLEMFGLVEVADAMVGNLPLGMKRKLEIAMAFIADPEIVVLDEPFAGLSDIEIEELLEVLRLHVRRKTVIIVEHKISKIRNFVERLAVMHEGRIVADGKPEETLEHPEVRRVYWKVT